MRKKTPHRFFVDQRVDSKKEGGYTWTAVAEYGSTIDLSERRIAVDKRKQRKLERAGWRVGSTTEFLQLSPEEAALVEMRLNLSRALRDRRIGRHLSQVGLAKRLGVEPIANCEDGSR